MDEAIFILLVLPFSAFAVWLAVRIINRRERWTKRIAAVIVAMIVVGYRQPASQNVLSFSCTASVNLGSVAGTGQKSGSGSCTIVTDAETGYNLSWTVRSGSGGVNTGSLINQYNDVIAPFSPSVADTPDTWSVAASSSAWGARMSSRSTDTKAEWGTDGASDKWLNVATTTRSVVSRATPTSGGGSTEILQFRAEVGSSGFKPTGTYQATVTMTAVTL